MRWTYKLPLSFISIIILFVFANAFTISYALKHLQEERLKTGEVVLAKSLSDRLFRKVIEQDVSEVTNVLFDEKKIRDEKIEYILIFDKKGYLLSHTYVTEMPKELLKLKNGFESTENYRVEKINTDGLSGYDIVVPIMEGITQVGTIHMGIKNSYLQNTIQAASSASLKITFVVAIIGILIALFISRAITGPINKLTKATAEISMGKLDTRVELRSRDEFGQLASSFNKMVHDLKSSKEALEEARDAADDASRTKSTFLANMSHELRTPLNAIIGYSEMLQEEAEDLGQAVFIPDLQNIHGAGRHLMSLINDVLDLSKIEAGKMDLYLESFELVPMINEVVATVKPLVEKNANTLQVDYADGLGAMRADLTKVRQTLFNLLSNACKFTERGIIALRVARESVDDGHWINFRVSDTGIGMSPEQTSKIFQAFTQVDTSTMRKFGGTGLGLAISRKFCQMMGGEIMVESALGQGSTFTARLPAEVVEPKVGQLPPLEEPTPIALQSSEGAPTVLVIDDDPAARDLMHRFLNKEGLQMIAATSGEEGIRLARELHPVVITLDVLMPGMDGWAVLTALKADPALSNIPVIMVSIMDEKNMGYALGAADYLTKPIDWQRLNVLIKRYQCARPPCPVLIVEDDAGMRTMLRRRLEKEAWTVIATENGRAGLDLMEKNRPELILLDLMMPEMDGFQFLDELRKHEAWRSIPVIVVTAKELTAEDRQRLNGSVEKILQKGAYSREDLLCEVRDLVTASMRSRLVSAKETSNAEDSSHRG
jgi:signal transduction histidine kinase/CheY-like chemotaxis protein